MKKVRYQIVGELWIKSPENEAASFFHFHCRENHSDMLSREGRERRQAVYERLTVGGVGNKDER